MDIMHKRAFIEFLKARLDLLLEQRKAVPEDDPTHYVLMGQYIECQEMVKHLQETNYGLN